MAVGTIEVTISQTNSNQQISSSQLRVRQVTFQSIAGHAMQVGDTNITGTRGYQLAVGSTTPQQITFGPFENDGLIDLQQWYVRGTQNDKLEVIYLEA